MTVYRGHHQRPRFPAGLLRHGGGPYGIAHGSRTPEAVRRYPRDLLAAAAPVWLELLRHGGALGVSFNTHLLTATDLADLLAGAGLEVVTSPAYQGFSHWVDQGITRDVVVARKP